MEMYAIYIWVPTVIPSYVRVLRVTRHKVFFFFNK